VLPSVGILAFGSLIDNPGKEIEAALVGRKTNVVTPFRVEFARKSTKRGTIVLRTLWTSSVLCKRRKMTPSEMPAAGSLAGPQIASRRRRYLPRPTRPGPQ